MFLVLPHLEVVGVLGAIPAGVDFWLVTKLDSGHWLLPKFGRLLAASRRLCIPALPTPLVPVGLAEWYLSDSDLSRGTCFCPLVCVRC